MSHQVLDTLWLEERKYTDIIKQPAVRGTVNVLIAFTDIGPGDGGTMVIPGSHKSKRAVLVEICLPTIQNLSACAVHYE